MKFKMTQDALDNYGNEYQDVILEVVHTSTKYMPSKEFYAKGMPQGYHPGFDNAGMPNIKLYDLKRCDNGEMLNFSLYNWELKRI